MPADREQQYRFVPSPYSGGVTESEAISYDFVSEPAFDEPLIPSSDDWPTFDGASVYTAPASPSSPRSQCSPAPLPRRARSYDHHAAGSSPSPSPSQRPSPTNRKHIPRPQNAFVLFRTELCRSGKISYLVERDHRHISRIIGHCWHSLSEKERQQWKAKAEAVKLAHRKMYPNYKFAPRTRTRKPVKRNVRRKGNRELLRDRRVAELLLEGKHGDELAEAIKELDDEIDALELDSESGGEQSAHSSPVAPSAVKKMPVVEGWSPEKPESHFPNPPAFRSPLLPPSSAVMSPAVCWSLPSISDQRYTHYPMTPMTPDSPVTPITPLLEIPPSVQRSQTEFRLHESFPNMDIPLPPAQHFSSSHPHPRPSSNLLASLQTYEPPAFHDPLFDPNTMYPPSASSLPPFPINSPPRSQTQYNDQIQHLQDPMSLFFNPNPFLANEFQNPLNSEFVDMSFLDGIGIDNVTRGSYDNRGWEESGTYCGSGTMNLGGD